MRASRLESPRYCTRTDAKEILGFLVGSTNLRSAVLIVLYGGVSDVQLV